MDGVSLSRQILNTE